jgi:hypothetical protein
MGRDCSTRKERNDLEDIDVDGRILKCIFKTEYIRVKWTHMAQNRGQFLALVNTEINFWVDKRWGLSLAAELL